MQGWYTVQLVGGHNIIKEGRVHMCQNGMWHSLCADNWSGMEHEADVVCSSVGYSTQMG